MKLLFVVNEAGFFLSHRLPIALAAKKRGFDVHLAANTESEHHLDQVERHGVKTHRITLERGFGNPAADMSAAIALRRLYRYLKPDIAHHVTPKPVLLGTPIARQAKVPAVLNAISGLGFAFSSPTILGRITRKVVLPLYRAALRSGQTWTVVQNETDRSALRKLGAANEDRLILIPGSGVDLKLFAFTPEEPTSDPIVVFPARMLRDKGLYEFCHAAKELHSQGVRARFVLVGKVDRGNPSAATEEEMRELLKTYPVEWWGNRPDMPTVFAQSHVVCLPSYREGLPKALVEACAVGRSIVTTDVPGCRDVVQHGVNGLLVPVRDAHALGTALRRLIEDPELRARYGAAGHQRAQREYSVDSIVRQTFRIYEQMLQLRGALSGAIEGR